MNNQIAQVKLSPSGGFKGLGTGILANPGQNAISVFAKFMSTVIGLMTIIAFVWFVLSFLIAAINIMTSAGDKQALEAARQKMRSSIIGVVVVVAAVFVVNLIGSILGIPNILDIQALFTLITK